MVLQCHSRGLLKEAKNKRVHVCGGVRPGTTGIRVTVERQYREFHR